MHPDLDAPRTLAKLAGASMTDAVPRGCVENTSFDGVTNCYVIQGFGHRCLSETAEDSVQRRPAAFILRLPVIWRRAGSMRGAGR